MLKDLKAFSHPHSLSHKSVLVNDFYQDFS